MEIPAWKEHKSMKINIVAKILILIAAFLLGFAAHASTARVAAAPSPSKAFQYKVERISFTAHIEPRLNELGKEGWELVTYADGLAILKR
jgi:hypothetical protein